MTIKSNGGFVSNKVLVAILLAIAGFFCANLFYRILAIQSDLVNVQVELTKLRGDLLGKEEIRDIAIMEIYKYHKAIHHDKKTEGP